MPSMLRPFSWFWTNDDATPDQGRAPVPTAPKPRGLSAEEKRRQAASAYLVALSRRSPRGQAYAQNADDLRSMLQRARETDDIYERHAIINAMRTKGMINDR